MYQELLNKKEKLAVIGLGYVGLPVALEFAKKLAVIGFDINEKRVAMLKNSQDPSKELPKEAFEGCDIQFTASPEDLAEARFYIIAVPTPIDDANLPDLKPLLSATELVGSNLKKGDYVVYESTVYPGCTEEDCVPLLEKKSGLKFVKDFKVGYSPERINPGDKEHTLTTIKKITSGCDAASADTIAKVYEIIIKAGVFTASSIKVAEAAKVIENTQRDINIAFMNELSIIFNKMNINTYEVLEAAGTKWNFLKFFPGLVGGHCIGVDPYYLTSKAQKLGYHAQIINAGRFINDSMGRYVAKQTVKMILAQDKYIKKAKVLVMGITFKENVSDIRNSKVADLIDEFNSYGVKVDVIDPFATADEVLEEYNIKLKNQPDNNYDAIVMAVNHNDYAQLDEAYFKSISSKEGIFVDIKGIFKNKIKELIYWSL